MTKQKKDPYHLQLSQSTVNERYLKGVASVIWFFFGDRGYAPNTQKYAAIERYLLTLVATIVSTALYVWLDIYYFFGMVMIVCTIALFWLPLKAANESFYPGCVNLMIGALGYTTKLQFGFVFFHVHAEPYLFAACAIAGGLSIARRLWNALIWALLNRIIIKYCRQQGYRIRGEYV